MAIPREITPANRRNGIEWQGYVAIKGIFRVYRNGRWTEWMDGNDENTLRGNENYIISYRVTLKNGVWSASKPDISDISIAEGALSKHFVSGPESSIPYYLKPTFEFSQLNCNEFSRALNQ